MHSPGGIDASLEGSRGRQRSRQVCHFKEQVYRVNLIATRYKTVTLPVIYDTTELMQHEPLSSSVGDYVKATWEVAGLEADSMKDTSIRLSVAPASVTNMLGRLREMGLTEYERYCGASLTPRGHAEALRLVRYHRLIETFLFKHLGYSCQGVHEEAERLEHAVSDELAERPAELLATPSTAPTAIPSWVRTAP